ncbi:hypothetical protein MMC14_002810 [Varicellaria rhodocarpa]|nr:hypothetical protein [Varicellaria rhodocarpa]
MSMTPITVGVLALQGAFLEHLTLLHKAAPSLPPSNPSIPTQWTFTEVRTPAELQKCDALIIPGGESTTMSLVAERSGLLEELRGFVKTHRKPTWGTCAGLILLSESANRTKKGGQSLIGGLDVRVNRNHFGRQTESFETSLHLPFLSPSSFKGIFIRAPVVEKILPLLTGEQVAEALKQDTVIAPSRAAATNSAVSKHVNRPVEIMATLPGRKARLGVLLGHNGDEGEEDKKEAGDIVAVRQGNVFGTSFHPELTQDVRIHIWWLEGVREEIEERRRAT